VIYDPRDPAAYAAARAADDEILDAALALGGTLTGEHGVGSAKRAQMTKRFTAVEIAAMRGVKQAFDPAGILNPGILLPDLSPDELPLPHFSAQVLAAVDAARTGGPGPAGDGFVAWHGPIEVDAANLTASAASGVSLGELAAVLDARGFRTALAASDLSLASAIADPPDRAAVRDALLAVRGTMIEPATGGGGDAAAVHQVRFGSNAVKDVAGYDMKRLFIGGRGAFGQVDEAVLRLTPAP